MMYQMKRKQKAIFHIEFSKKIIFISNKQTKFKIWQLTKQGFAVQIVKNGRIKLFGKMKFVFEMQLLLSKIHIPWIVDQLDSKCYCCGKTTKSLKLCSGCQTVYFCSKKCQKINWKKKHRYSCTKILLNKNTFMT